jgi:hypothetical protein
VTKQAKTIDEAPAETLMKPLSLVKKEMKKILKRAPSRGRIKMKALRREIGTQLLLIEKKQLKKMMAEHLGPNAKKMFLDGKDVILITVEE